MCAGASHSSDQDNWRSSYDFTDFESHLQEEQGEVRGGKYGVRGGKYGESRVIHTYENVMKLIIVTLHSNKTQKSSDNPRRTE